MYVNKTNNIIFVNVVSWMDRITVDNIFMSIFYFINT